MILFFLFLVAVNLPWAWRSPRREIHWLRLGSVVVGMIMVLYLVYTEIITLVAICLYCTSVHIITFVLFVLTAFGAAVWGIRPGEAWRRPRGRKADAEAAVSA